MYLAERVGFEPTCRLPDKTLSRRPRYDHFGTSPHEGRPRGPRTVAGTPNITTPIRPHLVLVSPGGQASGALSPDADAALIGPSGTGEPVPGMRTGSAGEKAANRAD